MNNSKYSALAQQLLEIYQSIPKAAPQELADLTTRAQDIQTELDGLLAAGAPVFSDEQTAEILQSLTAAQKAADEACGYLTKELKTTREAMIQLRNGQKANRAYQPPAVGLGFTEGNFIDSKK